MPFEGRNSTSVWITGVSGFIGKRLAAHFHSVGWRVYGADRNTEENSPLLHLNKYFSLDLKKADLNSILKELQPALVLHCAGRASVPHSVEKPADDFQNGPQLVFQLLDSIRKVSPATRFLFLSSAAVYGSPVELPITEGQTPQPISPYGFHKWSSELVCREFHTVYGISTASVRLFSAYGPGLRRQVLWDLCLKMLREPAPLLQGTGEESRDFLHVTDIARGIEIINQAASFQGESYNLSSGRETTIRNLAALVLDRWPLEKKLWNFDGQHPQGNPLHWRADISKVTAMGFSPAISLETGVERYINWFLAEHEKY